jgi:hypothetical protein
MKDKTHSRFVIIKTRVPDFYEGADVAIIRVTENLVLTLDRRIALTKAMFEDSFYGTRWWDYTPRFVSSGGPDDFGLDMSEEDFEDNLEANMFIPLPDGYKVPCKTASIDTLLMTIGVVWQWTGYDKHVGDSARVSTYEMTETTVDEWAELIGCTEMLKKVRRCRGVVK